MYPVTTDLPPGVIALPTGMLARYNEFWDAFMTLQVPHRATTPTVYMRSQSPAIARNRNEAVRHALREVPWAEWVFFLDDDHEFPGRLLLHRLERLRDHPQYDVLGSFYVKKRPPWRPVMMTRAEWGADVHAEYPTWPDLAEAMQHHDGFFESAVACGGGGLLVRRRVFEKLGDPWFTVGAAPENAASDDIEFCLKVRDAGLRFAVDLTMPLGHAMPCVVTPEWLAAEGRWQLRFTFDGQGFTLRADGWAATD